MFTWWHFWGHHLLGAMLRKLAIFKLEKYAHMVAFFGITSWLALRWQGLPLYLFCLDWKKCYDRIHITRLLAALQRFGLPDHYLRILELIYSKMTFFVSDKWGRSTEKSQAEGLRQGDPLSCFLLVILMTVIMIDTRAQYYEECQRRGMGAAQQKTEKIFGYGRVCG